jgi:hypothetical protein
MIVATNQIEQQQQDISTAVLPAATSTPTTKMATSPPPVTESTAVSVDPPYFRFSF